MTPPKVPGAPKPRSSVIMSSTLGASFGGTTRGAYHGVDSEAFSFITPPNLGSGGGSCVPSIVVAKTTIVISHRLQTIRESEMIIVMDEGKVADMGTHSELLGRNLIYRHLWSQQAGRPA